MSLPVDDRHRMIEFEGARNFRDLGGYASGFGGHVRWGVLYRAAALHDMNASDLERFRDLGVVTIFDLRSQMELEEHPDPLPGRHVPLLGRFMAENERPDFASMIDHDEGAAFMREMLWNVITWGADEIGVVVTALARADAVPAVFHCMAGKDRTGVLAALLLEVLGVDRSDVLDDFALSDGHFRPDDRSAAFEHMMSMGMPPEAAAGALGAPREMLESVLDRLDAEYAGAERYLVDHAGVDATAIAALRDLLITPATG